MRGVVADEVERVLARALRHDLDRLPVDQGRREVPDLALLLDGQRGLGQPGPDGQGGVEAGGAGFEREDVAVGEGHLHARQVREPGPHGGYRRPMDPDALRAQYPVFEQLAYLNAGTCGPLPGAALRAGADSGLRSAERGRAKWYFDEMFELRARLRAAYAGVVGGAPEDVALTTGTSEGMTTVLTGLGLQRGDEVLTADDEHPGLYGPLAAARRRLGIEVRAVPLADIPDAVGPRTRLVACSHVSWISGALAPAALAELGEDVPVLLDGAQGAGAVPVDVGALGCAFYAAAGQKWLCGPVGTGLLWVAPAWQQRLTTGTPTYLNLRVPAEGLDAEPWEDARAFDTHALSNQALTAALAAHDVLAEAGWPTVLERAAGLAAELATRLAASGRVVAPRDATTLVSWEDADPEGTVARLADAGIVVRNLPGTPYLRASCGAWNAEADLERLLAAL